MNDPKWFCKNCQSQYSDEFLESQDVEDGICPNCYHLLIPITKDFEYEKKVEMMKKRITIYKAPYIWEEIELIKNQAERREIRTLFFETLKRMKIEFTP